MWCFTLNVNIHEIKNVVSDESDMYIYIKKVNILCQWRNLLCYELFVGALTQFECN